jgi:prolyl 3-hydroxylase /prolyl 3,4-dihydroxylase
MFKVLLLQLYTKSTITFILQTLFITIMLKEWINKKYLKPPKLISEPFPHLELKHFFNEDKLIKVLKALSKEKFILKDSDLFTFFQTNDLSLTRNNILIEFRNFIKSKEFRSYLSKITKKQYSGNVDMFGTLYRDTNYLLPHDDRLEKRKLAYFVYFSNLSVKSGGSLNLCANNKVIKRLFPKFNTFSFFEVSSKSLHQVEEVLPGFQRITITGWFH